ncbi:MAG: response regulator [Acidimicrobiia bacterium]|nr:response regulator [Acidimicrobiia bacterium]
MGWTTDPELAELFRVELTERSERLVDGARAMIEGRLDAETSGVMLREGHTIKGTGRVMGFVAISVAGERLESTWRTVQAGERAGTEVLGQALETVSLQLIPALEGDPETGSTALTDALAALESALSSREPSGIVGYESPAQQSSSVAPTTFEDYSIDSGPAYRQEITPMFDVADSADTKPEPAEYRVAMEREPDPSRPLAHTMMGSSGTGRARDLDHHVPTSTKAPIEVEAHSLGGLVGALEKWEATDSVTVNAGQLYSLIGAAASLRIDVEALSSDLEVGSPHEGALGIVHDAAVALREEALELASAPLSRILRPLSQLVGYLSRKTEKEITLTIEGGEIHVDRQVSELLAEPLRHLIVNAVEHGIESAYERTAAGKSHIAQIRIAAHMADDVVVIEISDDGRGIDWQAVEQMGRDGGHLAGDATEPALRSLLFSQGTSTSDSDTDLVGEGSGLAQLRAVVERLYGALELESADGAGTKIRLTVPMSRVLQRAHLVRSAGRQWGVPASEVTEILDMSDAVVETDNGRSELIHGSHRLPLLSLAEAMGLPKSAEPTAILVLVGPLGPFAISVAEVVATREVAARSLKPMLDGPDYLTGAAMLGGGAVALILDTSSLLEHADNNDNAPMNSVLVVDDSLGVREVLGGVLAADGWLVDAVSGMTEALEQLEGGSYDAVVVDYDMPEADGVETAQAIRTIRPEIPIVLLSGVARAEDHERALAAGVDLCLQKGSGEREGLGTTLRNLIKSRLMEPTQ